MAAEIVDRTGGFKRLSPETVCLRFTACCAFARRGFLCAFLPCRTNNLLQMRHSTFRGVETSPVEPPFGALYDRFANWRAVSTVRGWP